MLDTFGFPTPQGANYQEFYGGGSARDWIKPRGASMVRMILIGAVVVEAMETIVLEDRLVALLLGLALLFLFLTNCV
jgi:hypothetical protein